MDGDSPATAGDRDHDQKRGCDGAQPSIGLSAIATVLLFFEFPASILTLNSFWLVHLRRIAGKVRLNNTSIRCFLVGSSPEFVGYLVLFSKSSICVRIRVTLSTSATNSILAINRFAISGF